MKRDTCIMLITVGLVVLATFAIASVPRLINYQGVLTDAGGQPINGTHDLTFKIYPDSAVSAPAYWTEAHTGVQFDNGLFHVILGGSRSVRKLERDATQPIADRVPTNESISLIIAANASSTLAAFSVNTKQPQLG